VPEFPARKKIAKIRRSTIGHDEFIDPYPDSVSVFELGEYLFSGWVEQVDPPALLDGGGGRVVRVVFEMKEDAPFIVWWAGVWVCLLVFL
jgi:hypothetical protein